MQVHAFAQAGQLGRAFELADDGQRRAVELGTAHALTDCVSMVLDLATDTGDFALADTWVASLPPREQMESLYRIKLVFNLAHLALARGDLALAEAELKTLGDVAALPQPYDRGYAALRHAELCLARGDAAAALAWVERGHADATHIDARTRMLAVRVRALRALHGEDHTGLLQAVEQAKALLAGPHTVPALAELALRRDFGLDRQALVDRLACSLDKRPAQRARFLSST